MYKIWSEAHPHYAETFPMLKRPGRETNLLPMSSAEVKNSWNLSPQFIRLQSLILKQSDKFDFKFCLLLASPMINTIIRTRIIING
jgi:hypothetical protein